MSERDADFERLLDFVRDSRAFDFTGYKRPSLMRRIAKRMHERGVDTFGEYEELLRAEPDEFGALFDTIMINVTSFFRDEQSWDFIAGEIVPRIADAGDSIRVWSTGCATGEEAYTVAMLFSEALGEDAFKRRVKIYATDIDEPALTEGRHARYTPKQVEPVPAELREKYLEESNGSYVFRQDLRRNVIFGRHDLIQDPPISRIDLLVSRNTLMYFTTETQEQILQSFHFALRDGGFLFLGKSEALVARSHLFTPVDLKRRVFAKAIRQRHRAVLPPEQLARLTVRQPELEHVVRETTLEASPTAQVVVGPDGKVVLANAHARALFGLTHADVGRPIQDLPLSYRPVELRSRIDQASNDRHAVWIRDVEWVTDHHVRVLDVQVAPLIAPNGELVGTGITFTDVTRFNRLRDEVDVSKRQLETAHEELQSTIEELETTNEELQSTNEELETTNEELQSSNEELETMNEELQSTNEELEAINDELQQRTDELNETNLFLESVLAGMRAAVVVVDGDLRVDAWNEGARELWGLRSDEALGKHLLNLDIGLPVDGLRAPIRELLSAENGGAELTLRGVNRRGRPVNCHVELAPLDGSSGIRGVIVMVQAQEAEET